MKTPTILAFVALPWLAALRPEGPESLVRQGNRALAASRPADALAAYDRAGILSLDPGRIAFNKAVAFARLGEWGPAEFHFRLALQDAEGSRRARALFNRAGCLLHLAGPDDMDLIDQAIASYRDCLASPDLEPSLADEVRHNLEIARLRLADALARRRPQPRPETPDPGPSAPSKPPRERQPSPSPQDNPGEGPGRRTPGQGERTLAPGQPGSPSAEPPLPGAGNLPVVPDRAELVPLSPEEARAQLRQAAAGVAAERRAREAGRSRPPVPDVPDW